MPKAIGFTRIRTYMEWKGMEWSVDAWFWLTHGPRAFLPKTKCMCCELFIHLMTKFITVHTNNPNNKHALLLLSTLYQTKMLLTYNTNPHICNKPKCYSLITLTHTFARVPQESSTTTPLQNTNPNMNLHNWYITLT